MLNKQQKTSKAYHGTTDDSIETQIQIKTLENRWIFEMNNFNLYNSPIINGFELMPIPSQIS